MNRQHASVPGATSPSEGAALQIKLPDPAIKYEQGDERCSVQVDGRWVEIRFHDYARIYQIQGLYDQLFYEVLKCSSPKVVREILESELDRTGQRAGELRVLDLGAGNGLVGQQMADLGVDRVVGVDLLPEAALAAERDRAGVYHEYHVLDISDLTPQQRAMLTAHRFNALTCVAALGFDDIPPTAFRDAFNLVETGGWIAFTLKDTFLSEKDPSGFSKLIRHCVDQGVLEVRCSQRYRHRLSADGSPLYYTAMVGIKNADIPARALPG